MKQRGYFTLPSGQKLHFSANCWYNLLEDTGMQVDEFGKKLEVEFNREKQDVLSFLDLLTDLVFAAAKANDQEEGTAISYNRYKVRSWVSELREEHCQDLMEAMMGASAAPNSLATGK